MKDYIAKKWYKVVCVLGTIKLHSKVVARHNLLTI